MISDSPSVTAGHSPAIQTPPAKATLGRPRVRPLWRLTWLDTVLTIPPWAPEGDPTFALRAREI